MITFPRYTLVVYIFLWSAVFTRVTSGYISHNEKATLFSGLIEHCRADEKIMFGQQ